MIERYGSGGPGQDRYGYRRVVVVGPFVLVAGATATRDGVARLISPDHLVEVEVEAYR